MHYVVFGAARLVSGQPHRAPPTASSRTPIARAIHRDRFSCSDLQARDNDLTCRSLHASLLLEHAGGAHGPISDPERRLVNYLTLAFIDRPRAGLRRASAPRSHAGSIGGGWRCPCPIRPPPRHLGPAGLSARSPIPVETCAIRHAFRARAWPFVLPFSATSSPRHSAPVSWDQSAP